MNITMILGIILLSVGIVVFMLMATKRITDKDIPNLSTIGEVATLVGMFLIFVPDLRIDIVLAGFLLLAVVIFLIERKLILKDISSKYKNALILIVTITMIGLSTIDKEVNSLFDLIYKSIFLIVVGLIAVLFNKIKFKIGSYKFTVIISLLLAGAVLIVIALIWLSTNQYIT